MSDGASKGTNDCLSSEDDATDRCASSLTNEILEGGISAPHLSSSLLLTRNQSRKSGKRSREDAWHADHRVLSSLQNTSWEKFYRGTVVPEEEWESFVSTMRRSLPMSLRVNTAENYSNGAGELASWIRGHFSLLFKIQNISFFLPEGYAFQCDVSRGALKRETALKKWKQVISALNEGGYITRQEAVSMLPPVLLQVEPGQRVLDMCAAPGSKSSQILEMLCSKTLSEINGDEGKNSLTKKTDGVLVANDVSVSRLDILHHQTNRSAGAHPHLIITNYDASRFPLLASDDRFHRVLCDVMCSGDGTLRKSLDLWPRWNVLLGPSLHASQCRVLRRGMKLCQQDGIVVYSTCSLNPVENEAVVSTCLADVEQDGGKYELIDPSPFLLGWQCCSGVSEWVLWSKDSKTPLRSYKEAEEHMKEMEKAKSTNFSNTKKREKIFCFLPSMFPNTTRLAEQHIERCCRILPHQQDTGGFFVAAMRCMKAVPLVAKHSSTEDESAIALDQSPLQPPSDALREAVVNALQLPLSFSLNGLVARNETKREQKIYYAHLPTIALSRRLGEKVVSVGCKVFEAVFKYSWDKFRFASEGVSTLLPLLPPHFVFSVSPSTILAFAEKNGTLSDSEFLREVSKDKEWLSMQPPCFLLRCILPPLRQPPNATEDEHENASDSVIRSDEAREKVQTDTETVVSFCTSVKLADIVVGVERVPLSGQVKAKVPEWQAVLCRIACSSSREADGKESGL